MPSKRSRKAAEPARRPGAGPDKKAKLEQFAADFEQWLHLALDPSACLSEHGDVRQWVQYFQMRRDYPGMPMLPGYSLDTESEDDSGEEDADEDGEPEATAPVAATEAGKEELEDVDAPAAEAGEAAAGSEDEEAGDDDDDTSTSSEEDHSEAGLPDADQESDGENGEEIDLGRDELDACLRRPAERKASVTFKDPTAFLAHLAVTVDKVYLREKCQTLQTCIRAYALAQMKAVDVRMQFHHKQLPDGIVHHIFNLHIRSVDAEQMVQQLPMGGEWRAVYKSFINEDGVLCCKLAADRAMLEEVRSTLLSGSSLHAEGALEGGAVGASELFAVLLSAVGCDATDLVKGYTEAVGERVRQLFAKAPITASKDTYDERGPAWEDPFDKEDYPVPDENCAQQ